MEKINEYSTEGRTVTEQELYAFLRHKSKFFFNISNLDFNKFLPGPFPVLALIHLGDWAMPHYRFPLKLCSQPSVIICTIARGCLPNNQ